MSKAAPELDVTRDFGQVMGDPTAKYQQNDWFYNSAGEPDRPVPAEAIDNSAKPLSKDAARAKALIDQARERASAQARERAALSSASAELEDALSGERAPRKSDPTRENLRAAQAEADAE
jgi:hypothetical protein